MGLLTFTQIDSEVNSHFANRADISGRVSEAVDLAQMRIARLNDWDNLQFLVRDSLPFTGTAQTDKVYDLSTGLASGYRIKNLYSIRVLSSDGRSVKLRSKTMQEFDEIVPEPEYYAVGFPEIYTRVASISGGSQINPAIEIWPVVDQAYNIELRFQVWPRFRTDSGKADGDTSDLMLDDAIIALATSYLYNSLAREDKARFHFGIYSSIVNDALKLDETNFENDMAGVKVDEQRLAHGEYWNNPRVTEVW